MIKKPDYHQQEEFQNRTRKLADIRQSGIEPYPHRYTTSHSSQGLQEAFYEKETGHSEDAARGDTDEISVAGRLILFRSMGKNSFAHLQDHTGRVQVMFNRDLSQLDGYQPVAEQDGDETISAYKFIEKKLDLGDILGVKGHVFRTQKGELTIFAKEVTLLCKTLLPLADKHEGLHDKELRYRKRWLDLISHPDIATLFRQRTYILQQIRVYFEASEFLEVETPILQSIYGGAEARPFETNLNALDQGMFLRISLEPPLKKLMVGGMHRIYELGRVFRNEGIDRTHNPEFTLLEAYAAYWDYHDMMSFVEKLFEKIAIALHGSSRIPYSLQEGTPITYLDMKTPWKRISMKESLQEYCQIDVDSLTDEEIRHLLKTNGHGDNKKLQEMTRGLLIAALFAAKVEPHLIQPHHIIDHPVETTPFCKLHRNSSLKKEGIVERFESFIAGQEICNAYSELNDPEMQRMLLEKQALRKEAGDEEASPLDEEFIEAICQGMPPTGGIGIGIDRLIMLMTNSHSIRDVLYFPWMKPL